MPSNDDADILGMKTIAKTVEKTADGIGKFLGKICLPVADELGLYFQDHVKAWRTKNAAAVVEKAESILSVKGDDGRSIHPLLAWRILEESSLSDSNEVQSFWAGLLASSCEENPSDGNLIFLDILGQLTTAQVRVIKYACELVKVKVNKRGVIHPEDELRIEVEELLHIAGSRDIHKVDIEMDRLCSLGLFWNGKGGIMLDVDKAVLTPSPLCLHLFARCSGHTGDPAEFYRDRIV